MLLGKLKILINASIALSTDMNRLIWAALALPLLVSGEEQPLFIYPERFGNVTLGSCSDAPSCGTTMTTYNGIDAKSNGKDQCTGSACGGYGTWGYEYQCVEYAQRYFNKKYGTEPIWHANAKDMCNTHPSGVSKTSNPKAGDLVVFGWGTYGHVAVITGFSGSSVNVVEQNSSPTGKNTYSKSDAICYLTASGSSSSCHANGWYCGNDGLGKDPNTRYYCESAGGSITKSTKCDFTCVIMPSGQDDQCTSSGTCANVNTGYYCGGDKVNGDKNTLYYCKNSQPNGATYCANGCHTASSGYDDYCN